MKNFYPALIILTTILSICFSSCSSSDSHEDNEKPTISNVRFNYNDTIIYNGIRIKINDSLNMNSDRIDTLVIGKMIYLTAHFRDNLALSSYKVVLDSLAENKGTGNDSVFTFEALGADIFGYKKDITDTIISRNELLTTPNYFIRSQKGDTLQIREGAYQIKVVCGDKYGGENSRDSVVSKIMLYSRKTIYDIRKTK